MNLLDKMDKLEEEIKRSEAKSKRLKLSVIARKQKLNRLLDSYYEKVASLPYPDESTKSE